MTKRALVIGGDGARGAFAAGVLTQLRLNEFDVIYGVSSGAINAHYFSTLGPLGPSVFWQSVRKRKHFYGYWFGRGGLFSPAPIQKRILEHTDGFKHQVRTRVVVTSMSTGGYRVVDSLDAALPHFVSCSAAIPGMCDVGVYVDGGLATSVPIGLALAEGATDITVILNRPRPLPYFDYTRRQSAYKQATRAVDIMLQGQIDREIEELKMRASSYRIYQPEIEVSGLLEFNRAKIENALRLGTEARPVTSG